MIVNDETVNIQEEHISSEEITVMFILGILFPIIFIAPYFIYKAESFKTLTFLEELFEVKAEKR